GQERAEALTFLLAEQHLIEHIEPIERHARLAVFALDLSGLVEKWLAPADFVNHLLDLLRGRISGELRERLAQVEKRRTLALARLPKPLLRQHENATIVDGIAQESVELRMRLRRHAGTVAADEAPQRLGVLRVRGRDQRQQHRERDRHVRLWRVARMDMPNRVRQTLLEVLPFVGLQKLLVFVDVARNDV